MRTLDILLVEDNEGDVEMTINAFQDGKYGGNIIVANDGLEGLDCLHKRGKYADTPVPKLILLDLNMPRMDGLQFLEKVKVDNNLKVIPIVMFTSSRSLSDIQECYERQVNGYVVKPFESEDFMKTVREIVSFWGRLGQLPRVR